jgi:hypothetical protein
VLAASYVDLSDKMLLSSDSGKFLPGIYGSIKYLNLSHNQLTGILVGGAEQPICQDLKVLDLSYNQLNYLDLILFMISKSLSLATTDFQDLFLMALILWFN